MQFDDQVSAAVDVVSGLAAWSTWQSLMQAARVAPTRPGVYLARQGSDGVLLYVGHAGERLGSQPGLRGRLGVYATGRGAVSGLGEAALDCALADTKFLQMRLHHLEQGRIERTKDWARAALAWSNVHVCWATTATKADAGRLEKAVLSALDGHRLWNKARPSLPAPTQVPATDLRSREDVGGQAVL